MAEVLIQALPLGWISVGLRFFLRFVFVVVAIWGAETLFGQLLSM